MFLVSRIVAVGGGVGLVSGGVELTAWGGEVGAGAMKWGADGGAGAKNDVMSAKGCVTGPGGGIGVWAQGLQDGRGESEARWVQGSLRRAPGAVKEKWCGKHA